MKHKFRLKSSSNEIIKRKDEKLKKKLWMSNTEYVLRSSRTTRELGELENGNPEIVKVPSTTAKYQVTKGY